MNQKTQLMVPKFYLYHPDQTLCITHIMTLGRTRGDFVLDDANLSATHCEFIPRLLNLEVKDLNSTNGVFVNKQKIFPNIEVKLNVGDKLRVGGWEFIVFDNEADMKNVASGPDRRQKGRSSISIGSLLVFSYVKKEWILLYTLSLIATVASFIMNLHLDLKVPAELNFLIKIYDSRIVRNGIQEFFLVYLLSASHALLIKNILKSAYHRFLSVPLYLFVMIYFVNFSLGPVWYIKQYVLNRETVFEENKDLTAINQLKRLINAENNMRSAFQYIENKLNENDKVSLNKDFQKMRKIIASKKVRIVSE
jgi:hypothetical protein